ncbi:mitogen-activated protein kinase kinase kinase YODA-like [Herrania umbratica]|uniref:Mitogen-activated protein kinase kinase kinase YODA-like n=1 Tax=Herrania umbratica TaxID=108875 RepID=A0A6J1ANQ4_9ROSI|nr:mitogen-activated protein kinase kinase kinase YODA-like [Herrania umbratica]
MDQTYNRLKFGHDGVYITVLKSKKAPRVPSTAQFLSFFFCFGYMSTMECGPVAVTEGFSFRYDTCIRWIKLKTLGRGSYGVVHLVKIIETVPRVFAVKRSPPPCSSLWKEYRILQQFRGCPNIVQCFDMLTIIESEVPKYNLFLDYAPGGDLLNLIKKYGGKILVYPSDQPDSLSTLKIADFGLAKEPEETDGPRTSPYEPTFRGTALYMSPESVKDGNITAVLDIWSLGCVVVEMMTGNPPLGSVTTYEKLAMKIASTDYIPDIPQDMSNLGKDFLMKCFAKDPRNRWTAAMLRSHPFTYLDSTYFTTKTSFLQVPSGEASNPWGIQPVI